MPKEKAEKTAKREKSDKAVKSPKMLSVEKLRHAEYYEMQGAFDDLYAKSKAGKKFSDLMELILSRENILLAYRRER